jgi:hypothetical protein
MEFIGKEVNVDISKAKQVGINEIVCSDSKHPILYTKNIKTCLGILIICADKSYMAHILDFESFKEKQEEFDNILKNEQVREINIFDNSTIRNMNNVDDVNQLNRIKTSYEFIANVMSYFKEHSFFDGFLEMSSIDSYGIVQNCSIGYNDDTGEYYGVDTYDKFYEYELGYENKTEDLLAKYK